MVCCGISNTPKGIYPYVFGYIFIPGGGFPPDTKFLLEYCIIDNNGKADLGLPFNMLRDS